ncbi:YbaN family protein [Paenibacillus macerans]|uniref:YbaN family protein n=1 Tax=Paenibacillus macerans TaxID=44252 RepID=UPI00203DB6DF|nr:YbaN family protein [Paenibacillus macerans]MCM3701191.1 YbaN family protein [Paenibacillus macerans]
MKYVFVGLGFLFVGFGVLGIFLPVLPTTPFLLVAAFFFSKGSKKFNDWFLSSRLYKKYLRDFAESRSMPLRTKLSIMALASLLLAIVFIFAQNLHVRLLIGLVWIIKTYYFLFRIKTVPRPLRGGAAE